MKRVIQFMVDRSLAGHLVAVFLAAVGTYAVFAINREAFPNVNLDRIQIEIAYPGASPEEVERLVITPIEQEIKTLNGIDKMISVAFPGSGRVLLELDPRATNRQRLTSDVQLAVDRADLPADLPEEPRVVEVDATVIPVVQIAVTAPRTEVEMKRIGDRIRDELLEINGVAKVVIQGNRKAEIRVVVKPEALARERISIGEIATKLGAWNVNAPGGDLDTRRGQKGVRIVGEFASAADAADLVLRANERGASLRLRDVAQVTETLAEPTIIHDVSGQPAVAILVLKKTEADIIKTVDRIRAYLETLPERYGADVKSAAFQDFSQFTRLRLGVMTNNAWQGLIMVLATLVLFLRPSVAVSATWGFPAVFLGSLWMLYLAGTTINLVSMMGFIIVLGMLVDEEIVVGENITWHMERGLPPHAAAVTGTMEMMGPITASIMTTIVAFVPLMFMSGIIGKFIVAIPTVVITMLLISWLQSFLLLPTHVADLTSGHRKAPERPWLVILERGYAWLLGKALRLRWLTLGLAIAALAGSVWLARTQMSFVLFPPAGVDQFLVRVTAPAGTNLETMRRQLVEIDRELRKRVVPEHVEATLLTSGQIAIDEGDLLTQRGSRYGQLRAIYTPAVARPDHNAMDDMFRAARELPPLFPAVELGFTEIRPGPPTGRALEAELTGLDEKQTAAAARRLVAMLEQTPGVTSVDSGLKRGDDELRVVLDRALAAYTGVDLATAARHVRAAVGGLIVTTVRWGTEEVDVTIRYPPGRADETRHLAGLLVPNERGGLIPLERVARFVEHEGFTAIRHKSGVRVINVVADVSAEVITSAGLNRLVTSREAEWLADAKGRVTVAYGGEQEKNVQSVRDLLIAMAFALLAIFFILAMQFNNLRYPFFVMLAIPFGIVGIIVAFYLHNLWWKPIPLSFFAVLGMVALSGVVVNSSLLLLTFVQRALKEGRSYGEALMLAGRRRLRAVFLTSITTVVGLLPTAYGWGGTDPFVQPLALALGWGLAAATLITLFVIPGAFMVAVDIRSGGRWLWRRLRRQKG